MKAAMPAKAVFPYSLGGLERFTAFLANALVDLGVDVEVISPPGKPLVEGFDAKYKQVFVEWPRVRPHKLAYYIFSRRVTDYLLSSQPDIVYGQGSSIWTYVDVKGAPCIYNPHGMEEYKDPSIRRRLERPLQLLFNRKIARKADVVISLGGELTGEIRRFLRVPERKIRVIPNAVDLSYVDRHRPVGAQRRENSLLFVGRIARNKGICELVRAIEMLSGRSSQRFVVQVVGSGPLFEELRRRSSGLPIEFLGIVDEATLFDLYWTSDAFVYPSLFEGMPTVVIEAMACGLPIISTNIGGLPDLVDGSNGFVVRPGRPDELAAAIEAYLGLSREKRLELGRTSREKVEANFTWRIVAERTLSLMKELVSVSGCSGANSKRK